MGPLIPRKSRLVKYYNLARWNTLPETNSKSTCQENNPKRKLYIIFQPVPSIFRCELAVSFREGNCSIIWGITHHLQWFSRIFFSLEENPSLDFRDTKLDRSRRSGLLNPLKDEKNTLSWQHKSTKQMRSVLYPYPLSLYFGRGGVWKCKLHFFWGVGIVL